MKIQRMAIGMLLLLSVGGTANAAFVIDSIIANSTGLDVTFSWNGDAPSGLERLFTSSYWTLDAKTNPGTSSDPIGIFVLPKHETAGAGRTHDFSKFFQSPYVPLSWEYVHGAGLDQYTLQYLSVTGSSGSYTGAQLRLTGVHVAPVPVPAALWLFGSGLLAFVGYGKLRRKELSVAA